MDQEKNEAMEFEITKFVQIFLIFLIFHAIFAFVFIESLILWLYFIVKLNDQIREKCLKRTVKCIELWRKKENGGLTITNRNLW